MKRRDFLYGSAAAVFAGSSMAQGLVPEFGQTAQPLWQAWRDRFMRPDGRVVDTLQDQASHSEGQGYGMLLASHFDDTEAFAKMFQWTERNLAIRSDPLLAWRWLPDAVNAVPDRNNASDGDLFYAWALVRAAARFEDRAYMTRAKEIAQALAATCIVPMPGASGRTLLLPAQFGFKQGNPCHDKPVLLHAAGHARGCGGDRGQRACHLRTAWRGVSGSACPRRVGAGLGLMYRQTGSRHPRRCRRIPDTKQCACRYYPDMVAQSAPSWLCGAWRGVLWGGPPGGPTGATRC